MNSLETFFDSQTSTLTYIVYDKNTSEAVIIDPVWDLDLASGKLSEESHHKVKTFLSNQKLNPILVLETHAHLSYTRAHSSLFFLFDW